MTTSVVVKANHGWDVEVAKITPNGRQVEIVKAGTEVTVYVWDGQDLRIHELNPDAKRLLSFGEAIEALKTPGGAGRVARLGWNGKGMWLARQVPDTHSKMSLPYIYMKTADEQLVPWLASQTDVQANDWEVL